MYDAINQNKLFGQRDKRNIIRRYNEKKDNRDKFIYVE